jgi:hypothetical protein
MPENACIAVRINAWRTIKLLAFRRTLTKNCWQKGCSMREIELEALLETASDAALVVDLDGVIFYANPSAEKLFALRYGNCTADSAFRSSKASINPGLSSVPPNVRYGRWREAASAPLPSICRCKPPWGGVGLMSRCW